LQEKERGEKMNLKALLKWGNKWDTGKLIFTLFVILGLLLFMNRFNLLLNVPNQIADFCMKENVKFWQGGTLQLIRSFLEHFSFNFLVPIFFVIFYLGFDRLFQQYMNWRIIFVFGALTVLFITFVWEFQKRPVEWIEVIYDLLAVILSYVFCRWMLKEFNITIKQHKIKVKN